MTDNIRWFRCVGRHPCLTIGKLYPATTVDLEGDLAVVNDEGYLSWVVITESYKTKSGHNKGQINNLFKEVLTDED